MRGELLLGAFLLDLIIGDPSYIPHPVVYMGRSISFCEKIAGKLNSAFPAFLNLRLLGFATVLFNIFLWLNIAVLIENICGTAAGPAGNIAYIFFCSQLLAAKGLRSESMRVYGALSGEGLDRARNALSRIVGRDTDSLDFAGIIRAAVETVAENFSDGVIAPMLALALFGLPGGYVYKVINTMDSMLGYKSEKYIEFGFFAAKTDDLANLIPSRLSALLLIITAPFAGLDIRGAWRIFIRDRYNHSSPNSAQTEAAEAGALGIRLGGESYYFGKPVNKPYIGDALREAEPEDIVRVNRHMYIAAFAGVILML